MRKHTTTIHLLVPILVAWFSVASPIWGWGPALAETGEPTLRELIQKRGKKSQPAEQAAPRSVQVEVPEDSLGRGTPRSSIQGFLTATKRRQYQQAAEYLDLRNMPGEMTGESGPDLARQLKIVFDRVLIIDLDLLSAEPQGDQEDNLPPGRDRIGRIPTEGKAYDILLQRVDRGDGTLIWKFAGPTVADIPELYEQFGYGRLEQVFPAWFFDVSVLGIHVWLWVAVIGISILMYPVASLIMWLAVQGMRPFHPDLAEQIKRFFTGPLTVLIWTVLVRNIGELLGPSVILHALRQARTVQLIALAWLLMRFVDFAVHRAASNLGQKGLTGAAILLKPAARLIKLVALAGAVLVWLDNIGYEVTTLLAGLSISGIAVALASQKSLENIFGAITLFTSQPVRVGDFCRFGDQVGTVEEIGLRATKIRTLDRTVITVPNAEFANMHLDNFSERDRFWYHPLLGLRQETTPDQIRYLLVEIRKMLYAHPKVLSEPLHVRFRGFGEYSLDLEVFAYIGVTDYTESLEIAEDLNLRVMDIVSAAGTEFAVPAQVQYSLEGKPFDEKRAQGVGGEVKEWKTKQALYLPNFPKEKIAEVKGSLDYPPTGSPQAAVPV
ncbi:MAG TPA: mechanosensitive ion channel family protein [Nitrospiraceae bacterium]|nr:mechanosensitive ion channel family protein [Nitrospiraceae bacterium]